MRLTRSATVAWGIALIAAVAACSNAPEATGSDPQATLGAKAAESSVSDYQKTALADGSVSYDEYHEGFRRYSACLAEQGYEIVVRGEVGQVIDAAIPAEAVDSGADRKCYEYEFVQIDDQWQIAHQDQAQDSKVLDDCLRSHGITVPESRADKVAALVQAGVDLASCLTTGG